MAIESTPLRYEQYREIERAETKIAEIGNLEDFAALCCEGDDPNYPDRLRLKNAEKYKQLIGVYPEHRLEYKAALERIRDTGKGTVGSLIELFSRKGRHLGFSPELPSPVEVSDR